MCCCPSGYRSISFTPSAIWWIFTAKKRPGAQPDRLCGLHCAVSPFGGWPGVALPPAGRAVSRPRIALERFSRGSVVFMVGCARRCSLPIPWPRWPTPRFPPPTQPCRCLAGERWRTYSAAVLRLFGLHGHGHRPGIDDRVCVPRELQRPYVSKSITEFWKRWHMSLSNWLREYLYISLGATAMVWCEPTSTCS